MRLTEITQEWLASSLKSGDIVIDATLGNGFDALFLAQKIGATGHLFGFDVQETALEQSRQLLEKEPCQQTLFLKGHEKMGTLIPKDHHGAVQSIMFNLGWLPGSDKSIITQADTTVAALTQSIALLAVSGKLSVMVYPGHQGGDTEAIRVIQWLEQRCGQSPDTLSFEKVKVPNRPTAPILLKIQKLG